MTAAAVWSWTMSMNSRKQILEHLKRSGEASVAELSRALSLTPVTIRHHLEALKAEKLIADPRARRKSGPGRPEMVYQLTARADRHMPRNYGELCACLLETIRSAKPALSLPQTLGQMGVTLGIEASMPGKPGSKRRARAVRQFLESRGYFPDLAESDGALKLTLANCPYLEAARETQALCNFDHSLLAELFGQEVRVTGRIVDREPVCTFSIARGGQHTDA